MSIALVYEMHSISTDKRGVATGWLPGELSEEGRRLALELGERRRGDRFAVVYVSDLRRALETAELAFAGTEIPIRRDPRLRECNYGELNGRPVPELDALRSRHIDTPFPGGESYRQVIGRMRSFLRDLSREWPGNRVLVIGHAATRFALDHLLRGVPLEELVEAPFAWQPGWVYALPSDFDSGGS